ncbi:MAG: ABC transporter substrate-binding protein [Nitrospirae bacterium]|nr:ABC transporter substrate-binding protein [Nitrospirota bacterium]
MAVQSFNIKLYDEALKGFNSVCDCQIKRFVLSEMEGIDVVKTIREARPDIIIAIGTDSLIRVKKIKDIPIVYLMVPNPQTVISEEENITGVSMNIPPHNQLATLKDVLPGIKRIGLLYNPGRTRDLVTKARLAASSMGIELLAKEVNSSKDVPALVNSMKGKINAFWMIPDTTVITPETVEFLLLFSFENKVPILAFSDKYVEMGALLSLEADAFASGKQAGEIARKILSGTPIRKDLRTDPGNAVLSINLKIAKKLGITISNDIIHRARIVDKK